MLIDQMNDHSMHVFLISRPYLSVVFENCART